jgi:hypothetical protein
MGHTLVALSGNQLILEDWVVQENLRKITSSNFISTSNSIPYDEKIIALKRKEYDGVDNATPIDFGLHASIFLLRWWYCLCRLSSCLRARRRCSCV